MIHTLMLLCRPFVKLSSKVTSSCLQKIPSISMSSFETSRRTLGDVIRSIEERVQRDEGSRGIGQIVLPPGELLKAALTMFSSTNAVVLTGFPCLLDFDVPTETDGPPGAIAITKALLSMGKQVKLLIDECNEDVLLSCASAMSIPMELRMNLEMQSFPAECDERDVERLLDAYEGVDLLIAIERAGPSKDGRYLTMRARDMSHLIAPLDLILRQDDEERKLQSIGIGDGGNELGMGKVLERIQGSSIPNADTIACTVATDYLLVASVSNWGGYALSAAALLVHASLKAINISPEVLSAALKGSESSLRDISQLELPSNVSEVLESGYPTSEEETLKLQRMIDAGARDGITREQALMVDGMSLQASLDVLNDIGRLARD